MPRFRLLMIVPGFVAGLGGCVPFTSDEPIPVTSNYPNPAPVDGYHVECTSRRQPLYDSFHAYTTSCQQVIPPESDTVVVRARG